MRKDFFRLESKIRKDRDIIIRVTNSIPLEEGGNRDRRVAARFSKGFLEDGNVSVGIEDDFGDCFWAVGFCAVFNVEGDDSEGEDVGDE